MYDIGIQNFSVGKKARLVSLSDWKAEKDSSSDVEKDIQKLSAPLMDFTTPPA